VLGGLLATALVCFLLSNVLLEGPDPEGWWNFIPGILFYVSLWLILALTIGWAVRAVLIGATARLRRN